MEYKNCWWTASLKRIFEPSFLGNIIIGDNRWHFIATFCICVRAKRNSHCESCAAQCRIGKPNCSAMFFQNFLRNRHPKPGAILLAIANEWLESPGTPVLGDTNTIVAHCDFYPI